MELRISHPGEGDVFYFLIAKRFSHSTRRPCTSDFYLNFLNSILILYLGVANNSMGSNVNHIYRISD